MPDRRSRLQAKARAVEATRWSPVLPRIAPLSDPIVTSPAYVTIGELPPIGGHAFLTTMELAVSITEAPRSEERPLVNVTPLGMLSRVAMDDRSRLVVTRGADERMTLDLFPSEFSRALVLGLRERWERIADAQVDGDWSAWAAGVVRSSAWIQAGA
ncbi:MAG: hypothetical protein ACLGI8_16150 [Acidimicrobiia bacterium]